MSGAKVINFDRSGTRAMLEKVLEAYDAGRIQSVVLIGQGYDEENKQRCVMPMVSEETNVHELSFASVILQSYAGNVTQYMLSTGKRVDA